MSIGNIIARMRDRTARDTISFSRHSVRRCRFCGQSRDKKGGKMIGSMWRCAGCAEVVQ